MHIYIYIYVHTHTHRVSQEERSIFWEVTLSVILSKNVYMNNRKIVDKKEILCVLTVSNTGIYCSSDEELVHLQYNKCSKIPPSKSILDDRITG